MSKKRESPQEENDRSHPQLTPALAGSRDIDQSRIDQIVAPLLRLLRTETQAKSNQIHWWQRAIIDPRQTEAIRL